MVHRTISGGATVEASTARDEYINAYRLMLLARVLDEKFASLYRGGKIHGGVFLGRGQEALSVSVGLALHKGDVFAPLIRDQAGRLAFGETLTEAARTYLGSALGPMRGRDGNVHRGRPRDGYLPMISHLGAMISVVNGTLFAKRMKGVTGIVGAACIGEGATSTGAFHEAINQASVEKLPLVLIIADNQYAYSTPNSRQFACDTLAQRAPGYGLEAVELDGTELSECLRVVGAAVQRARQGGGPQMVVARLLRLCGHGEHDDASYVDPKLKASSLGRDCLKVAQEHLLRESWASPVDIDSWQDHAAEQVEEAIAKVRREPAPDGYKENWCALASRHLHEMFPEV